MHLKHRHEEIRFQLPVDETSTVATLPSPSSVTAVAAMEMHRQKPSAPNSSTAPIKRAVRSAMALGVDSPHPSISGIRYVIFPNDKRARIWDAVMIAVLVFYAFVIPYQFGISGGYMMYISNWWFAIFVTMNAIFIVDTFVPFFRAYRNKHGVLICNPKTIRRKYMRGWFILNLIASLPTTLVVYSWKQADANANIEPGNFYLLPFEINGFHIIGVLDILKLVRLARFPRMSRTSEVANRIWEKLNIGTALVIKFVFFIVLLSHWIACVWGFVAFVPSKSFGSGLLDSVNWISNWYEGSYVEGGINPIGWENHRQRYALCLFWSIQTLTSIGYGNIVPVTHAEFMVANLLMLVAGVFWAFVIGNLVDAASKFNTLSNDYRARMEDANDMLDDFTTDDDTTTTTTKMEPIFGTINNFAVDRRVRRHITDQRDRATSKHLNSRNAATLTEVYPTLDILSPELRKLSSLNLLRKFIDKIPYLSSRYLSSDEQAEIALRCVTMEFSAGESFASHSELGRGIVIVRQGCGITTRMCSTLSSNAFKIRKGLLDYRVDSCEVLVEDDYFAERQLTHLFVGYTKVLFIPRSVIMDALEKNGRAWKECARWRYLRACAVLRYSIREEAP